ncbi:MAG: hypothetical protein ACXW4M_06045 [Anaerolineales bacterium]
MSRYIPALSFHWLTPLYDPLLKRVVREETFKRKPVQQANIQPQMNTYMRRLEEAADEFDGLIPRFVTKAGFGSVSEAQNFVTVFGLLSLWRAVKGD